jgi:hypothetical protein
MTCSILGPVSSVASFAQENGNANPTSSATIAFAIARRPSGALGRIVYCFRIPIISVKLILLISNLDHQDASDSKALAGTS